METSGWNALVSVLWLLVILLAQRRLRRAGTLTRLLVPVGMAAHLALSVTLALQADGQRGLALALFAVLVTATALLAHWRLQTAPDDDWVSPRR